MHPPETPVILRPSYLAICGGSHCAAMLLSLFEHWHAKPSCIFGAPWFSKSTPDMVESLLGLYKRDTVLQATQYLIERGFIEVREDPGNRFSRTRQFLFHPEAVIAARGDQ